MKPIAQTFLVSLPNTSIDGVFLNSINVYFASVSSTYGITVQIRTTENGVPTSNIVSGGQTHSTPSQVSSSTDSSVATSFAFSQPPFIQTNVQYAIVLIPDGGNSDYEVWTATVGGTDALTNSPIYVSNQLGNLFISSNDLVFTAVVGESMKYDIYINEFTSTSANIFYHVLRAEFLTINNQIGTFAPKEIVYVSNSIVSDAVLNISPTFVGSIGVGNTVYQTNGTSNVATGVVNSISASAIYVTNVVGTFSNTTGSYSNLISSTGNATISSLLQGVSVTNGANTFTVPNSNISDYAVNNTIYVLSSDRSVIDFRKIVGIPSNTTLSVATPFNFTNTSGAIVGRMAGDAGLFGCMNGTFQYFPGENYHMILGHSSANASVNFANLAGQYLFGMQSGATATIVSVDDLPIDSLTPNINYVAPAQTAISFSFAGTSNTTSYVNASSTFTSVSPGIPNEFTDNTRYVMSRSNELAKLSGNNSFLLQVEMSTANNLTAPWIDFVGTSLTFTHNIIPSNTQLSGYYLSLSNTQLSFVVGEVVTQGSGNTQANGVIAFANGSALRVNSVNGYFNVNSTPVVGALSAANAAVTAATWFDETLNNGYYAASRYISKNVILSANQNAEDLILYMNAFRAPGSNFNVYGKFLNNSDPDAFAKKAWSYMPESDTTSAQFSSLINRNNTVELEFGLPVSVLVDNYGARANSTSNTLIVQDTSLYNNNTYIYISDNNSTQFNVREITHTTNSTVLQLLTPPSFTSSNVSVGAIPSLQSATGAFKLANNSGIVRYVNSSDVVYDTFQTFAIKVVPTSNSSVIVPIMNDVRAIALQV